MTRKRAEGLLRDHAIKLGEAATDWQMAFEKMRAERDRYARALRRVVRYLLVEWSSVVWAAGRKSESNKMYQKVVELYAREARGPWRETWGGREQ